MIHREIPNRPAGYEPRVVVKLRDQEDTRARVASLAAVPGGSSAGGGEGGGSGPSQLQPISRQFPGARIVPLATSATPARLQSMVREAQHAAGGRRVPNLNNFYAVTVPRGTDPNAIAGFARELTGVEKAYLQGPPTPPPVTPADDPNYPRQRYLNAAAVGVDATYAWTIPGGDGRGIQFIDIEQGWALNHEDLTGSGVTLLSGLNAFYHGHGTAVLGEILAQDNTRGCVGITPLVSGKVISQHRTASNYSTYDAIIAAIVATRAGDVILLEAQTTLPGGTTFLPVEIDLDVWAAIWVGTLLGRVIVEAAGNGNTDLDNFRHPTDGFIFKRGHADFRDSGAIMVGGATSAVPHARMVFPGALAAQSSNYGGRINCYGWGQNIETLDATSAASTTGYRPDFNGTSGASPIVTGAAIALQAMHKARHGRPLSAQRVRDILSDPRNGTRSNVPAADKIGCMPDLRKIVTNVGLAPAPRAAPTPAPARRPVGDFPTPRADVRPAALIDAGHGGEVEELVPAYGAVSGRSAVAREKDINLELARRVCGQLGNRGVLSRSGDYNMTLRERIERARAAQAAAFVSIHSNTGRTDRAGPEVWIYGDGSQAGGAQSQQLAHRIGQELATVERGPVPIKIGNLAVLKPELHGQGVAACLVETGSLEHPEGAARLSSQQSLDQIGAAVARGVNTYLSYDFRNGVAYGSVTNTADTYEEQAPTYTDQPWEGEAGARGMQAAPAFDWCTWRATVVRLARAEEARWTRPDGTKIQEGDPAALPILTQYWRSVPGINAATAAAQSAGGVEANPFAEWSAAFISHVMAQSGATCMRGFRAGPRHLDYIVQALRNREYSSTDRPFWLVDHVELEREATPEPGDLICFNRMADGRMTNHTYSSLRDAFWNNCNDLKEARGSSHCALVVGTHTNAAGQTFLETIGGNESNSVMLRRNIRLNANGNIDNPRGQNIFGMIKMTGCRR